MSEQTPLGRRYLELTERAGSLLDGPPDGWDDAHRIMDEADRILDTLVERNVTGREHEKASEIDQAKALYEANVRDRFHGSHPYERLRIIYAREGRYDDAIRVCEAYIEVRQDAPEAQAEIRRTIDKLKEKASG